MIIWLSSYPKSGNTLLRSILATYFFSTQGEFQFDLLYKIEQFPLINHFKNLGIDISNEKKVFENFIEAQKFINRENKKIKFLKTHSSLSRVNNCNFTDLNNTFGAIYIVRDTRNVITSFAHHYDFEESGLKTEDIKKMIKEKRVIYDYKVDQKKYKWSGKSVLKKINTSLLPKYISSNLNSYKEWLD